MASEFKKRPTLRTIADKSGFAVATVSRALSNAPDIGADTKEVVRRIAQEIGYTPNRAGLRLRTGKTNVISIVMDLGRHGADHTGLFVSAVARGLAEHAYQLNVTPYLIDEEPLASVRHVVESQSTDAVIIDRTQNDDARVAFMIERQIPFATFGRTRWDEKHAYFDFDNADFAHRCVTRLSERGRERILMILPPADLNCTRDLIAAGQAEAIRRGIAFEALADVSDLDQRDKIESALFQRLGAPNPPDAIICASAPAGIASVIGAERAGRSVGEDIDILSKETSPFLAHFRPRMLVVQEDISEAGAFLARAVVQAIEAPEAPPLQKVAVASDIRG